MINTLPRGASLANQYIYFRHTRPRATRSSDDSVVIGAPPMVAIDEKAKLR